MKLQVGKCYEIQTESFVKRFRVIRNNNNEEIFIKHVNGDVEDFLKSSWGGIIKFSEIDCILVDGKESLD